MNQSPSAAYINDENLLWIHSPRLAKHLTPECRLVQCADIGITKRLQRKLERIRRHCGKGIEKY